MKRLNKIMEHGSKIRGKRESEWQRKNACYYICDFYSTFKEQVTPILCKSSHKIEKREECSTILMRLI